ncbi:type I restriction endonuclease [Campylobacter lari]|uniref:type I restriction endonuclease n=1 Tax=Campylobacter lari TaxID=201 RepID=UPI002149C60B|nr:type I restriction endonuclease [Campylobacter lari]MCR2075721.1 type I restriction endonuclease [Campylobacter lari subsp. concheus]MCR2083297.1 type I restriction endonuclease [Campylobacter lari subsp. concheus]MCR2084732.1 type I restriction endonuclease [Campylobacter lari subsp. concheus]
MDFENSINSIAETIAERKNLVNTEESTKMTFIMPFLKALGYDVFDPSVVVPEYIADIGTKKGEKVDYAIFKDGKPFIYIEAKNHTENLSNHNNQLTRYFNTSPSVKFAILTNGIEYRFFTDLDQINIMDQIPFLTINLEKLKARDIKDLKKFICSDLNLDEILNTAKEKKYYQSIQDIFKREIENPSDDFVVLFAKQLTDKRMTASTIEEFRTYIKKSFKELINDIAYDKITSIKNNLQEINNDEDEESYDDEKEIITTEEELQGFYIVKSILASAGANLQNISYKDTLSYFAILYQNRVTKWICRLNFTKTKKWVSFPDDTYEQIEKLEDLYKLQDKIIKSYNDRK